MKNPQISIITPFYNRFNLLAKTIESVLWQTMNEWELILIDDGSKDDIKPYIEKLSDNRIKLIKRNRKPKGAPTCRNIGLSIAKSKLIIFLDSDDILAPWALEKRIDFIKRNSNHYLYIFEGLEFNPNDHTYHKLRTLHGTKDPLKEFLDFQSCWQTSCVIWTKEALTVINGWDESALSWQDGEIHIRFLLTKMNYTWALKTPDVFIRRHDNPERISNNKTIEKYISLYETYEKIYHIIKSNYGDRKIAKSFKRNYKSMLFDFIEGLPNEQLMLLNKWINKTFFFPFKLKLLLFIKINVLANYNSSLKWFVYQFRKIGIPNKRRPFWTKRPKLNDAQTKALLVYVSKYPDLKSEVFFLRHLEQTKLK